MAGGGGAASEGGAKRWRLMRQDDNGNEFEMARYSTREEAERVAAMYTARGHKQLYWVEAVEAR